LDTVVRSGTSRISSTQTMVTSEAIAAIRKMNAIPSPYAARTASTCVGLAVASDSSAPVVPPSSADTRPSSSTPSRVTPTVPPSERRNATSELAAPTSVTSTVFCTASTRFCMVAPIPMPSSTR
jgi:hypothetical protein